MWFPVTVLWWWLHVRRLLVRLGVLVLLWASALVRVREVLAGSFFQAVVILRGFLESLGLYGVQPGFPGLRPVRVVIRIIDPQGLLRGFLRRVAGPLLALGSRFFLIHFLIILLIQQPLLFLLLPLLFLQWNISIKVLFCTVFFLQLRLLQPQIVDPRVLLGSQQRVLHILTYQLIYDQHLLRVHLIQFQVMYIRKALVLRRKDEILLHVPKTLEAQSRKRDIRLPQKFFLLI